MRAEILSAVTETIYEAALDPAGWQGALVELGFAFGCNGAALVFFDTTGSLLAHVGDGDPQAIASYVAHYRRCDRVFDKVSAGPPGLVWSDEMVQTKAELHRSEFYADWGRKADMEHTLQAIPLSDNSRRGFIALARPSSRPAFDNADVSALDALLPHLRRAMAMHIRLSNVTAMCSSALDCLARLRYATFFVDSRGMIAGSNSAAEALLSDDTGLRLRSGTLETPKSAQSSALRRLIGNAVCEPREGGWISIDQLDESQTLRFVVLPIGAGMRERLGFSEVCALIIVDGGLKLGGYETALAAMFALTSAEARVAALVARGASTPKIATALRVSPSTVRSQLQQAFKKTNTCGQTELGVLVSRLPRSSAREEG